MVKFRVFEILVLIVVVGMICLFLHGCHSPFTGENTFIASPSYVVDGNLYIKKADIKLDSARHLILKDKMYLSQICQRMNCVVYANKVRY